MKNTIAKAVIGAAALFISLGPIIASADPPLPHQGDPNLCMSNPAYHRAHDTGKKSSQCQGTALNDFGGNGGMPDENGNGMDDRIEPRTPATHAAPATP